MTALAWVLASIIVIRCARVLRGMDMGNRKQPYWWWLGFGLSYVAVAGAALGSAAHISQGQGTLSLWAILLGSAGMILFDRRRRKKIEGEALT